MQVEPKKQREYIYIRLEDATKNKVKELAASEGVNMTIWVRQLILKTIAKKKFPIN